MTVNRQDEDVAEKTVESTLRRLLTTPPPPMSVAEREGAMLLPRGHLTRLVPRAQAYADGLFKGDPHWYQVQRNVDAARHALTESRPAEELARTCLFLQLALDTAQDAPR
jgi:hypothetical protein